MPLSEADLGLVEAWNRAKENVSIIAKPLVEKEMVLRRAVAVAAFADPKEGTNKVDLPNNWQLKLTHPIDRRVLEAELDINIEQLKAAGINVDEVVRWKPELNTKAYRELTDEQRKLLDTVLNIKPGTPSLELVPPKTK